MTLSLVKSPPAVSLVGNDILFKLNTDNQFSSAGGFSNLGLVWSVGDSVDESFTLSWGNNSITFTAKASPDESGLQYTAYTTGTVIDWMNQVAVDLATNYLLSSDFEVSFNDSQNVVQIKAREKGSQYSFTVDAGTSGLSVDSNTAGVDRVDREFYHLLCNVWIYNSGWVKLGASMIKPDVDGNVLFKIQEYLAGEMDSEFTYPEANTNLVIKRDEFLKQFFVEYAETYDSTVKKLFPTNETATMAMAGKISKQHVIRLQELEMTFFDEIVGSQMFLSWHPLSKTIGKWHPEKLYYLNFSEAEGLKFWYVLHYDSGISFSDTFAEFEECVLDIYEVCCGFDILGLALSANTIEKYEIFVTNQRDELISEIREFVVDHEYQEFERVFLFANSLGAYETLRTTGLGSKENEFKHDIIELVKESDDLGWTEQNNHQSFMDETFEVNSGWISKEVIDWTNEFFLSTERYIIENHQLYSIIITSKKVFQHKDMEELYSVGFEFKKSIAADAHNKVDHLNPLLTESAVNILTEDEHLILI